MIDEAIKITLAKKGFSFVRTLGKGGFGEVFLAEETISENYFAIKMLHSKERFHQVNILREIRHLGRINHQNIISYKNSFKDKDSLFLVMEYCSQGNFHDFAGSNILSFGQIIDLFIQLAQAFNFLHEKGIVHHDIKPANMLVSDDKTIKISDFGTVNTSIGTILYSAPEMLEGSPTINDCRVDIYALGISLLELLNQAHPFAGLTKDQIIQKVKNADLPILNFEPWFQHFILKACHYNPQSRFQTMSEFGEALINRNIPVFLTKSLLQEEKLVRKLQFHLQVRQWKNVRSILYSNIVSEQNLGFTILKGKYFLATHDLVQARNSFEHALILNRNASVEKELAEVYISENQISKATSLLLGYLNQHFFDAEALNLLLQCYFISGRWEIGLDQALLAVEMFPDIQVFLSNLNLFQLLNNRLDEKKAFSGKSTAFMDYNKLVYSEKSNSSWNQNNQPFLSSKLLFHEYRFLNFLKPTNTIVFQVGDQEYEENKMVISFGRKGFTQNDYDLFNDPEVSRRHFVIINQKDNVWLYDLGSWSGVYIDGVKVQQKTFLLGRHIITFGKQEVILKTNKHKLF